MYHNYSFPLLIWPQSERVGQQIVGNAGSRELWHIWLQEAINLVFAACSFARFYCGWQRPQFKRVGGRLWIWNFHLKVFVEYAN